MRTLEDVRRAVSPRFVPPPTPLRSVLIHGGVATLWLALFARAWVADGPFAWSTGLVYVGYDTFLLVFVAWQTLPLARRRPEAAPKVGARRTTLGVIVALQTLPVLLLCPYGGVLADRVDIFNHGAVQHHNALGQEAQ